MGKAGRALKQVLETSSISPSRLADAMGVDLSVVLRWCNEKTDPTAEKVANIVEIVRRLEPSAATEFICLYLGDSSQFLRNHSSGIHNQDLPESNQLNIAALSRLFSNTTNSYKYLFLLSLLDILSRRNFEVLSPISFQEIIVEMLANAWYPHTFFKLSFGRQDKISQKLDYLDIDIKSPVIQFKDPDKKLLREAIISQDLRDAVSHLRRYVPFRLIVPFLETKLKDLDRGKGNQVDLAIPSIAERYFDESKPLYHFDSDVQRDCHSIIVHPVWATYLERHYSIVRGWISWEWMNYMQRRNPSTPSIAAKLFAPTKRSSLIKQTDYWRTVLRYQKLVCIYSQKTIDPEKVSLDHYLPWSFVAHDQLWNLIPTLTEVNSSKSNNLPADSYFDDFVRLQYLGLSTTHEKLTEGRWIRQVEPYIGGLELSSKDDLLDVKRLRNAYEKTMKPLMSLASNQGFEAEWCYK